MSDFNPQKVRLKDYPYPVGTIMRGSMGSVSVVVDRGGYAFLASCAKCNEVGAASGYYVQAQNGRILDRSEPAPEGITTRCHLDD